MTMWAVISKRVPAHAIVRVSVAVVKYHNQMQLWKERACFILNFHISVHRHRMWRYELTWQETGVEAVEEHCLLPCSR